MNSNEFEIEVLEDGTVKITTGSFSGAVHLAADKVLAWIEQEMGTKAERNRLGHTHHHHHDHEHHDHKERVKS